MADFSQPLPQAAGTNANTTAGSTLSVAGLMELLKGLVSQSAWSSLLGRFKAEAKSFFNPLEFSRPATQAEWIGRVTANASAFKLVYGIFFLPVLVSTMMSSMWLRIGSLAIIGMWGYAYGLKKEQTTLEFFGVSLPKVIACSSVSVFVMLLTGMINALFYALVLFAVVGMPHMSLHNVPAATSDSLDPIELQPLPV